MEKLYKEKFNKGSKTVWFYVDKIMCLDENQKPVKNAYKFICFFNFKKPTPISMGELVRNSRKAVVVTITEKHALMNAINHVKNRFDLED